jgi:hypothetical protein
MIIRTSSCCLGAAMRIALPLADAIGKQVRNRYQPPGSTAWLRCSRARPVGNFSAVSPQH